MGGAIPHGSAGGWFDRGQHEESSAEGPAIFRHRGADLRIASFLQKSYKRADRCGTVKSKDLVGCAIFGMQLVSLCV